MWLHDHVGGGGPSPYLESWVYRLTGDVDGDAVDAAVGQLVARHEALRTRFTMAQDQLVQIIRPAPDYPGMLRKQCSAEALDDELRSLACQPVDVAESPMQAVYLELGPGDAVLVLHFHHIVVDDWAYHILEREFSELYRAYVEGRPARLPALALQPGQYALARRAADRDPSVLAYWRDQLRGAPPIGTVPPDMPRSPGTDHPGALHWFRIDQQVARQIRATCKALRTTPFAVLAATVGMLLSAASGSPDVIVGTPVSRRGPADLDQMVACLVDLLPLRLAVRPDWSFADVVQQAKTTVHEAIAHADISHAELNRRVRAAGDFYKSPLCPTALVVDDADESRLDIPGVTAQRLYVFCGRTKFDLCFTVQVDRPGYLGFVEYATDLFHPQTAERITDAFLGLLKAATDAPASPAALLMRPVSAALAR